MLSSSGCAVTTSKSVFNRCRFGVSSRESAAAMPSTKVAATGNAKKQRFLTTISRSFVFRRSRQFIKQLGAADHCTPVVVGAVPRRAALVALRRTFGGERRPPAPFARDLVLFHEIQSLAERVV